MHHRRARILREYVLHILAGWFISYVVVTLFSSTGHETGWIIDYLVPGIIMITALLAATYRSWLVMKGKDPDGE